MKINDDTVRNHVEIIKEHLADIMNGLKNGGSKEFFRNEARSIISHAQFIIEECSEDEDEQ